MAQPPRVVRVTLETGDPLRCIVCRHDRFEKRAWKLNTTGMEFAGLGWANRNALCYVCVQCRFIHWFDEEG